MVLATLVSALGLGFGYFGSTGWSGLTSNSPSTALARVGFALRTPGVVASDRAWAKLAEDTQVVRRVLDPKERAVFDLVVANAGLETRGVPNESQVEQRCKELGWPACDEKTLRDFEKRVRP